MKIELGDIVYYKGNRNAYYVGAINVGTLSLVFNNKVYTPYIGKVENDIKVGDAVLYKKVVMV